MSLAVVLAPSILVVDAHPASRTHATVLLRNRWPDARVEEAGDAAAALAEAAESDSDLVIVNLPGAAGLALAQTLRARQPRAQVALVAGADQDPAGEGITVFVGPLNAELVEQALALVE